MPLVPEFSSTAGIRTLKFTWWDLGHLNRLYLICFPLNFSEKCMPAKSLSHDWLFATPWLQPARLLCPWDLPGKNTRVGCHFLLQGTFPIQVSNPHLLCLLHWLFTTGPPGRPFREIPPLKRVVSLERKAIFSGLSLYLLYHLTTATAAAKLLQSCPTLCYPIDGSPPGSPVPGILQARILEWVAIFFSNAWKWKVKVKSLSHIWLLVTPWTAAYQAPPSMGFSRQEYQSGVPLPSPSLDYMFSQIYDFFQNGVR